MSNKAAACYGCKNFHHTPLHSFHKPLLQVWKTHQKCVFLSFGVEMYPKVQFILSMPFGFPKLWQTLWERTALLLKLPELLQKHKDAEKNGAINSSKLDQLNLVDFYLVVSFPYSPCTLVIQGEIRKMQVYHQGNRKHRIPRSFSCMLNTSFIHKGLCTCTCTRTELLLFFP